MFRFADDVDSAEERFALALVEFSRLALAPRRVPPLGPELDSRQLELIGLAHRALWFGVELRLGDRERTARGFAAVEMLHGETRSALRREIAYAREQHVLTLREDIQLGTEPLERSDARIEEVANSWREAAYELGLPTFARWLGEASVLRELLELYGDLLRVVRVTALPLRQGGPDPAYLRSLLTLARAGVSGAAPRGASAHDLPAEVRQELHQEASRAAKLSELIEREDSGARAIDGLVARTVALARASDSVPPESKVSVLSIDRAPPLRDQDESSVRDVTTDERRLLRARSMAAPPAEPPPEPAFEAPVERTARMRGLPVSVMFGAQRGAASMLRIAIALAIVGLLGLLAIALLPVSFWWGAPETAQQQR